MDGPSQPDKSGPAPGGSEELPAGLLAQWRAAEERLYPMVMVIPEGYERVVRLVGAATVELQLACPDVASLVAEAPHMADRMRRLAAEGGVGSGLDYELIGAAACLLRYRLLDAELRRQQRIRRIAAAAQAGDTWVMLVEGAPPTSWPPLPTATVEMHLATGWAIEATITMDVATGAPDFGLVEVQLDAATGDPSGDAGTTNRSAQAFSDLREWRAAIGARRQEIEGEH